MAHKDNNWHQEYHTFVLRCWQEQGVGGDPGGWRFDLARLGDSRTRRGFACLEALLDHLQERLSQMGTAAAANRPAGPDAG
jgi:hypothetical protein